MQKGDRSLDTIYRCEKPSEGKIMGFTKEICDGLQDFHNNRRIHGDLKPQNFVRFRNKLYLIDFDASCNIVDTDSQKSTNFVGMTKFSSGIMPPEMIFKIEDEDQKKKYLQYFEGNPYGPNFWEKIEPKYNDDEKCFYCIKTFLDNDGQIKDRENLPYIPIKAKESIDLWSLGVLLFKLLSEKSLFETDKNEDLTSAESFHKLYHWNDKKRDNALIAIKDPKAFHLLQILLSRDPEKRESIQYVLDHPYINLQKPFTTEMEKNVELSVELARKTLKNTETIIATAEQSTTKLCNAIFEATEIDVPTCFIISPIKLDNDSENYLGFIEDLLENLKLSEDELENKTEAIAAFFKDPGWSVGNWLGRYMMSKDEHIVYLYLVDEYTCEPVGLDSTKYPIEIPMLNKDNKRFDERMKIMNDLVPVMLVGLKLVCHLKKGFGRKLAGFEAGESTLNILDDFVKNDQEENKVKGQSLQNFKDFVHSKDPKQNFCGLIRTWDENGDALWTLPENLEELRKEIDGKAYKSKKRMWKGRRKMEEVCRKMDGEYRKIKEGGYQEDSKSDWKSFLDMSRLACNLKKGWNLR